MLQMKDYLITLIENLSEGTSFQETLAYIYSTFSEFIPYTYIGIGLIEENGTVIRAAYGMGENELKDFPSQFRGFSVRLEGTSLKSIVETGQARIINDLHAYTVGKPLKEYNRLLLQAGIRSSITLPLRINERPIGIIFFSSTKPNIYEDSHVNVLKALASSIAISLQKNILTEGLVYSSILALAKMAESRDTDTGQHLMRMQEYSKIIGELLVKDGVYRDQLTLEDVDLIEKFSPLHDIGKVGVRDDILLKPDKLTKEEFETMKLHTIYGGQVLRTAETNLMQYGYSVFSVGIEIAEGHHEWWDGTGYPSGRKAHEIPISARIVALADVLDALLSKRPYKDSFSPQAAYDIIMKEKGSHFDPEIVRVVIQNWEMIQRVCARFISSSEYGA